MILRVSLLRSESPPLMSISYVLTRTYLVYL